MKLEVKCSPADPHGLGVGEGWFFRMELGQAYPNENEWMQEGER